MKTFICQTTRQEKIDRIHRILQNAYSLLSACCACPRRCGVNRLQNQIGFCGMGFLPKISSDNLHFGEEPPISGIHGSGTIFFAGCNLACVYCQNYPISQLHHGNPITIDRLAKIMISLQNAGAHNINLVTPTHFAPQIMGALLIAYQKGLSIPLVYNCGGYESLEMIQLWEGVIDIYMPDMKYNDSDASRDYSHASNYPLVNQQVIREMYRQVGNLIMDENGIARKGLLIRHLVLPENISGIEGILSFIATEISPQTAISLMGQYFPAHQAPSILPLQRRLNPSEYRKAKNLLKKYGFENGWIQNP